MEQQEDEEQQNEQEIWSWGAGTDGQLATGKLQDEHTPQILRPLSAAFGGPITSLSCGGAHVIALSPGGRVLTWGRGSSGQLGHGDMINGLEPKVVKALEGYVIVHASAGWNHSGFVSDDGALFTCGDGSFGQLGHGDYKSQCCPLQVSYFSSKPVEQVACGMRHSLVLLKDYVDNQVYGFGLGKRGQLGISTEKIKSTNVPQMTVGLTNLTVANISANGDHSAALSADGNLYTWGRGFGCASDTCTPRLFDAALSFNEVALGWDHALLLTRDAEVFMLGGDRHGVLGDPEKTSLTGDTSGKSQEGIIMLTIPDLIGTKVQQIAAGAEHSALVTGRKEVDFVSFEIYRCILRRHCSKLCR
ncbi:hypothetical protein BUALT_Bualt17G0060900 [Buddleja alternifolia]|uniref:RCC1-like domain-containing protein n=1 Tax=Buddleja alternifolia TaxID=168488 RepID=A0AAV6WEX9_9LAMI|nr:hypothetical protein BUALT_Bualt17G0060900 [Buddleja alternifolia]